MDVSSMQQVHMVANFLRVSWIDLTEPLKQHVLPHP